MNTVRILTRSRKRKRVHSERLNTITEIKNTLDGINSRLRYGGKKGIRNLGEPRNKPMPLIIYHKGGKNIKRKSLFSKWCWETGTTACKRMKLELSLKQHTKINSRCIPDLSVRLDTIRLQRKALAKNIHFDVHCSNIFLDPYRKGNKTKNKLGLIKLKRICTAKETTDQMGRQLTEWGTYLQMT